MRDAGNRVIYFAGYKNGADLFKREEIEAAAIRSCGAPTPVAIPRGDRRTRASGNIVQACCTQRASSAIDVPLSSVDRLIAIGSDG